MENFENMIKASQRWENETAQRSGSVRDFLHAHFDKQFGKAGSEELPDRYDAMTELHFSGMNGEVLNKIKNGEAIPERINIYYEGDEIKQMHAVYNGDNSGQNIDVYINGKALEDFLSQDMAK